MAQPQISEPWALAIKDAIGRIRILHVPATAAAIGAAVGVGPQMFGGGHAKHGLIQGQCL